MYSDYEYLTNLDLSKYAGKWVAILDSKVVASYDDIKDMVKDTAKFGSKKPIVTKVSSTARIL